MGFEMPFTFGKSEAELREETEALAKLIFPFGEEHRERIKAVLKEIDPKKLDEIDLMMYFIAGKKQYLRDENLGAVFEIARRGHALLTPEQAKEVAALVALDAKNTSPDTLPSIEEVRAYAMTIAEV